MPLGFHSLDDVSHGAASEYKLAEYIIAITSLSVAPTWITTAQLKSVIS